MSEAARATGPMPPWRRFPDFLSADEHSALLEWTLANRERFSDATISGGILDPSQRVASKLNEIGPHQPVFKRRLRALAPVIIEAAGSRLFNVGFFELQLAAHRDGAFFLRHSDIPFGTARHSPGPEEGPRQDRVVSAVYYFHREPKRFEGGALRLFRFGAGEDDAADHIDIEPVQNSLVVFPSWALHEVRPVRVPSGEFSDSRFAVNIWLCRALGAA